MAEQEVDIGELRTQMRELQEMMKDFKETIAPLKEKQNNFQSEKDKAYQEYIQKTVEIDKNKKRVDEYLSSIRRDMETAQREYQRVDSLLEQAVSLRDAENNLKVLEDRWNALTEDAPWRQFIMNHQQDASDRMVFYRKVGLFDVMGLGKTFSAIVACDKIKAATTEGDIWYDSKVDSIGRVIGTIPHSAAPAGRFVLYLSPAELVRNVEPEWKKWAPYRQPKVLSKRTKLQRELLLESLEEMKEAGSDILVLLNYESWRKDTKFLDRLIAFGWDTIICDEAHVLKNRESNAYRGVEKIVSGYSWDGNKRLADPIRFVFPMTGTPFLNKPQELYSILSLIEPKVFPNSEYGESAFLHNYCEQNDDNKWIFREGGIDRLAKLISNRYIRRTLKDAGIKLPPQTVTFHELDIDEDRYSEQFKARESMRDSAKLILDEQNAIIAPIMLTVYLRLRQIETWPAGIKLKDGEGNVVMEVNVNESQKMDYVLDSVGNGLLTEVCPDQRAVVFSQFNEPLAILAERAKKAGLRAVILDGSTPESVRSEIKVDFDRSRCYEDGRSSKWDVLFANYKVGGQGINLTDVTQTIALDEEWNPGKGFGAADDDQDAGQAGGRTFRIGQTEETAVHIIRMNNTVDTWLAGIIEEKSQMTTTFRNAMDKQVAREALMKGEL